MITVTACLHAVNPKACVFFFDLSRLDSGQCLDWAQPGVLGQCHWHSIQRIGESTHSILLEARALRMCQKHAGSRSMLTLPKFGGAIFTLTAASSTASEQAISAAPPPYTMRLSLTRFRTTQSASCRERLASSIIFKSCLVSKVPN